MIPESAAEPDDEINAISQVYRTLKALEPDAQLRVLSYVSEKLNLPIHTVPKHAREQESVDDLRTSPQQYVDRGNSPTDEHEEGDSDGISPAGRKWIRRSGLSIEDLSSVFSIGGEEIDLVTKKVPGDKKSKRMRSVFLLKGLAAYLASGAARFSFADVKETCLHYDAFDAGNFAQYFKGIAAEVSGSRETGYALTARGLIAAAEIVKQLINKAE